MGNTFGWWWEEDEEEEAEEEAEAEEEEAEEDEESPPPLRLPSPLRTFSFQSTSPRTQTYRA